MTKICTICRTEKPATREYFYSHKRTVSGLHPWCKACVIERNEAWWKSHPEQRRLKQRRHYRNHKEKCLSASSKYYREHRSRILEYMRDYRMNANYGITRDDYEKLLTEVGGVCAICKMAEVRNTGRLAVDHDHKTGQIRSLLCVRCNAGLGAFRDDVELLASAISYLEKHRKETRIHENKVFSN